jgi:hypothetical protein
MIYGNDSHIHRTPERANRFIGWRNKRRDSKLTEEQVRAIRSKFIPWDYGVGVLAAEFGVPKSTITNVVITTLGNG